MISSEVENKGKSENDTRLTKWKISSLEANQKTLKEKHIINLNYTYVVFGKNDVYKDKFSLIYDEVNKTFKKVNQIIN